MKETYNINSDEDFVRLKFRRDPMYSTPDIYEYNMSLFDHVKPEEFLLFVCKFNMNLATTGTLDMDAKNQYLRMLVCGEELIQVDLLSDDV